MKKLALTTFFIFFSILIFAQIKIDNASFEDEPEDAVVPNGWLICKLGSTPDILPGGWGVITKPSDGATYMGLITRADKTWESVGQRLSSAIVFNQCYTMSVDLAYSKTYNEFINPAKLRVWAGKTRCDRGQLLWESDLIDHTYWETYEFLFETKATYNYIIIEAFFPNGYPAAYKGNILIDNMSDIEDCKRA